MLGLAFVSCSDDGETEEEKWESRNTEYFKKAYGTAIAQQGNGSHWAVIKSVQRNPNSTLADDCIVVEKLDSVPGNYLKGSPLQTDSVRVHYKGMNIDGAVFDRSWNGDYDLTKMIPASFIVSGVVEGFSTALQYMHVGDRWRVIIPQKLGYGESNTSTLIPAYSTLVFDMTLDSFGKPGKPMPSYK